jgi:CelD/BcsL family acetyltransferase involved in cellulose biosynthesis
VNTKWQYRQVPIKFQLSDKTLFACNLWLQVREIGLSEEAPPVTEPVLPIDLLEPESQGFLIHSLPVAVTQPKIRRFQNYLCYVPKQYQRYYIDLRLSFAEYKQKFSSKTRSTINRKIKKYAEHCGGNIPWKVYKTVQEMPEFFQLARLVSVKTYQEKLLDAGLPDSEEFCREMKSLAAEGRIRAFILFDHDQPVSYLYCPIYDGVLIYQYLGYDSKYMSLSVGTILQWLALEHLFEEGCFRLFDFTEGQSEHKRLFATHSIQCANIFFVRRNLRNTFLVQSHRLVDGFSVWLGDTLDQLGLKAKVKKLMRFGR